MTTDEKISHIIERIEQYDQNGIDTFSDVESLDDIEYSILFFQCISYLHKQNKSISSKIINTLPSITKQFIKCMRGHFIRKGENWFSREVEGSNVEYLKKYTNGYFENDVKNNKLVMEYVGKN